MNVLHICDFASTVSGNFIAELNSVDTALKNENGGRIVYALTDRNIKRKNGWVDELKKEHTVYFYEENPLKKIKLFRRIIEDEKIDIVHVHFTDMKTDFCIRLAALGRKVKLIKHYRSAYGAFNPVKKNIGKIVYRDWFFICITPAMSDECRINYPACRNEVILNPIAFERLDTYEKLNKSDIIGTDDALLCLMVGYNYKVKGIDIAAEAVSRLREKHNAYLGIVVTTHRDEIVTALTEQFGGSFPEWIKLLPPRNDIASYYRAADICISPSRSEGACSAIIEEAYCGRIVVASDCAGQKSYAGDRIKMLWFENKNSDDLAKKLEEAIQVKGSFPFAESNRENALKYYGLESYPEKIIKIYKQ